MKFHDNTFWPNRLIFDAPGGGETAPVPAVVEAEKQPAPQAVETVDSIKDKHEAQHGRTHAILLANTNNEDPDRKYIKPIAQKYLDQFQKLSDPKALLERCKSYGTDKEKIDTYQKALTEINGLFGAFETERGLAASAPPPVETKLGEGPKEEPKAPLSQKEISAAKETERQIKIEKILDTMDQATFESILDSDKINDEVGVIKLNQMTEAQVDKLFSFAKGNKDNLETIFDEISYQGKTEDEEISVTQLSTSSIQISIEPFKDEHDRFAIFEKLLTTPSCIKLTIDACGSDKALMVQLIKQIPKNIGGKDPIKSLDTKALVNIIQNDKLENFMDRMSAEQKADLLLVPEGTLPEPGKELIFLNIFNKEAKGDLIKLKPVVVERMIEYAFEKAPKGNVEIMLLTGPALTDAVIKTLTPKAAQILLKPENQNKIDEKDRVKIIGKIKDNLSKETRTGLAKELKEDNPLRLELIKSILLDEKISPSEKAKIMIAIIIAQGESKKELSIGKVLLRVEKGSLQIKVGEYWRRIDTIKLTKTPPKEEPAPESPQGEEDGAAKDAPGKASKGPPTEGGDGTRGQPAEGEIRKPAAAPEGPEPKAQLTSIEAEYNKLSLDPTPPATKSTLETHFEAAMKSNNFGVFLSVTEETLAKLKGFQEKLKGLDGKFTKEPEEDTKLKALSKKVEDNIKKIEGFKAKVIEQIGKIDSKILFKTIEADIRQYDKGFTAYQKTFEGHLKSTPPEFTKAKELATGKQSTLKNIESQLSAIEGTFSKEKDSPHKAKLGELKAKLKPKLDQIQKDVDKSTALETIEIKSKEFTEGYEKAEKWTAKTKPLTDLKGEIDKLTEPKDATTKQEKLGKLKTQSQGLIDELSKIKEALTKNKSLADEAKQKEIDALIPKIDAKISEVKTQFLDPAEKATSTLEKTSDENLTQAEIDFTARESKAKTDISITIIQQLASRGDYKALSALYTQYEQDLDGILTKITPFEKIYKEPNLAKFTAIKAKIEAEKLRIKPFKEFATQANTLSGQTESPALPEFKLDGIELTINDEAKQLLTKLGISLNKDPKSLTAKSNFIDYDKAEIIDKIIFGKTLADKPNIKSININLIDKTAQKWEIATIDDLGSKETITMKGLVRTEIKTEISAKAKEQGVKAQLEGKEGVSKAVQEASKTFREITTTSTDDAKTAAIKKMTDAVPADKSVEADGITFKKDGEKLMAQIPNVAFQEVTKANIHNFAFLMKRDYEKTHPQKS